MNHLMIDLEAIGTRSTAPLVSIGAVFFEPSTGEIGPEFEVVADISSDIERGAIAEGDTIKWWLKQSAEARSAITGDSAISCSKALGALRAFVYEHNSDSSSIKVWGNGSTFDNALLRAAFERHTMRPFWGWYNDRDVRTIVELGRAINFNPKYEMPFVGIQHSALADAKHQAKYVSAIWQRLVPPATTDINM